MEGTIKDNIKKTRSTAKGSTLSLMAQLTTEGGDSASSMGEACSRTGLGK